MVTLNETERTNLISRLQPLIKLDKIEWGKQIPLNKVDWDNMEVHLGCHGAGDTLRVMAIAKRRMDKSKKQLVFVDSTPTIGAKLTANFTFVDYVIAWPRLGPYDVDWFRDLIDDWRHCINNFDRINEPLIIVNPDNYPELSLELSDLQINYCDVCLPEKYVVIQPSSTFYNKGGADFSNIGNICALPVVVVGNEQDKCITMRSDFDLRGKLSIEQSLWVAANATIAVGVESWIVIAAAQFGKPSFELASDDYYYASGEIAHKVFRSGNTALQVFKMSSGLPELEMAVRQVKV
jgi:hypothetical protein